MPQLKGTPEDRELIRTSFSFQVSYEEIERSEASLQEIVKQLVKRGVEKLCTDCVNNGYYVSGLERAYRETIAPVPNSYFREYRVVISLYVRRFDDNLTNDERYYWTGLFSERLLFEMAQLEPILLDT